MIVFTMTPEIALEFWERVHAEHLISEEDRQKLLLKMSREGKMLGVSETKRTKEQYLMDMAKEFRILDVSAKEKLDDK